MACAKSAAPNAASTGSPTNYHDPRREHDRPRPRATYPRPAAAAPAHRVHPRPDPAHHRRSPGRVGWCGSAHRRPTALVVTAVVAGREATPGDAASTERLMRYWGEPGQEG